MAEEEHGGNVDFGSLARGGAREKALTGKALHATQAVARTLLGKTWAEKRGLQVTFKATHSEHGADASRVLCRAWSHRMQFFFDMEMASVDPKKLFDEAQIKE